MTRNIGLLSAIAFFVLLWGCKEEPAPPPKTPAPATAKTQAPAKLCQPGFTQNCVCENGGEGVQSCTKGGQAFGACLCLGLPPAKNNVPKPEEPTPRPTPTKEVVTVVGEPPAPPPEAPPAAVDLAEGEVERVHADLPEIAKRLDATIARGKALSEFLRDKGGKDCVRCETYASKLTSVVDTTLGTCWAFLDRKSVGFDGYTKERKTRLERLEGSYLAMVPEWIPEDGDAFLKEWKGFLKEAGNTLDAVRKTRLKRYGKLPEPVYPICD